MRLLHPGSAFGPLEGSVAVAAGSGALATKVWRFGTEDPLIAVARPRLVGLLVAGAAALGALAVAFVVDGARAAEPALALAVFTTVAFAVGHLIGDPEVDDQPERNRLPFAETIPRGDRP